VDFFDFSECMNDLVTSGHLTLSEDGLYAITEKGLRNGQICESSLPYSVRLAADKNITVFNQKLYPYSFFSLGASKSALITLA